MIAADRFLAYLRSRGVDFFCGVPDSLLKSFCACLTETESANHVITANEGGAIGLAAGHYLATGKLACVYMQNSGQGNAVNPLLSLADPDVYSIPMVLLVGWRGEPGAHDEPQHVKQGKVTVSLFETLGIPMKVLPADEQGAFQIVDEMVAIAKIESRPVALVVRKGTFAERILSNIRLDLSDLKREDAIETILKALPDDAVVVSTTGMISREVYETRIRLGQDHSRDFLTVGSMGHAIMIATGIAKADKNRKVICLDGDGAAIMQLGNLAIAAQSKCGNLLHIVLNNTAHDSVGGQPTVGGAIDFTEFAQAIGYEVIRPGWDVLLHATDQERLASMLKAAGEWIADGGSPRFMEVRVRKGARKDLGRPKEPPQVNKKLFMETLSRGE